MRWAVMREAQLWWYRGLEIMSARYHPKSFRSLSTTQAWGHVYCAVQRTLQLLVTQFYKRWTIIIITKLGISITPLIVAPLTESNFLCFLHLPSDKRWKGYVECTLHLPSDKKVNIHDYKNTTVNKKEQRRKMYVLSNPIYTTPLVTKNWPNTGDWRPMNELLELIFGKYCY